VGGGHCQDKTIMTIHRALLPPDLTDRHRSGWDCIADELAVVLAADG
jgi:hypothetical protein